MKEIEDFRYISGHFFQDGYRHHFSSILGRFGLHFGMLFSVEVRKMDSKNTAKTYLQKSHAAKPEQIGTPPVVP